MKPFGLPADCPRCGGGFNLINSTSNGMLSIGVFRCEPCRQEFECTIRLQVHHKDHWKNRAPQTARSTVAANA